MTNMTGGKLSIFSHHGKITSYWITTRSFPYRANMGLDFVSGQHVCLFCRCRKYVINSLIHGDFHIGLVIIPRAILAIDSVSGQYGGLGMITRPIWKCPCINLYVFLGLWENQCMIYNIVKDISTTNLFDNHTQGIHYYCDNS